MNSEDQATLTAAAEAFQAKNIELTEALLRPVTERLPDHPAVLYLRGLVAAYWGDFAGAEPLFAAAIALKPDYDEIHFHHARALRMLDRHEEALAAIDRAIFLKPDRAHAHARRGEVLDRLGDLAEALVAFRRAATLCPDDPAILARLGRAHFDFREYAEAVASYRRLIELRPRDAAAHNELGRALQCLGDMEAAKLAYGTALRIDPRDPDIANNLGLTELALTWNVEAAERRFRAILVDHPSHVPALTHLGMVLTHQSRFEEALDPLERALARRPDYHDAANNLGNAFRALGRVEEAVAAYRRAHALRPKAVGTAHNLAQALLMAGDYTEGWARFEIRRESEEHAADRRDLPCPRWRGEAGEGRRLLVHAEQGFGDSLQFCRYAPRAAALGWRVTLEVPAPLVRLMRSLAGIESVIERSATPPPVDAECPMLSLPVAFATTVETIPADIPYLFADPRAVGDWCARLAALPGSRKIGVTRGGSSGSRFLDVALTGVRRVIPPEVLAPLAALPDVLLVNLWKDAPDNAPGWYDPMPECADFADTAALVTALDLVITTDTSMAHLAGALGRPVWLLNRFDSCWRWFAGRADSPWYPTMRIFRQTAPGDWAGVIERVIAALDSGG